MFPDNLANLSVSIEYLNNNGTLELQYSFSFWRDKIDVAGGTDDTESG